MPDPMAVGYFDWTIEHYLRVLACPPGEHDSLIVARECMLLSQATEGKADVQLVVMMEDAMRRCPAQAEAIPAHLKRVLSE